MPILGYPAHPEHDQAPHASVVFGVSDSDDRVRIPRSLLVDIVAVVVDALDVDTDQAALVEYLTERFADRVVVDDDDQEQDDEQDLAEYDLDDLAAWQAYACPDCGHLPGCGCDCCPYDLPAAAGVEQLVGGAR